MTCTRCDRLGRIVYPARTGLSTMTCPACLGAGTVDYEAIGRQAFLAGEPAAPALHPQIRASMDGMQVGNPAVLSMLRAFLRGWHAENVAA